MIDWHSHILPGVDDGAADMAQSVAMATVLSSAGFTDLYCTPHLMRGCYDTDNRQILLAVRELQGRLDDEGIPLTLHPGREYCLDEYLLEYLEDPLPLGSSRLILVEILPQLSDEMARRLLYGVVRAGFTPVIAHPERSHLLVPAARRPEGRSFMDAIKSLIAGGSRGGYDKERDQSYTTGNSTLDYLRDIGCRFQGNIGSFSGYYGRQTKTAAEAMLQEGLYDRYGSDLHSEEQAGIILKTVPMLYRN